MTIVIIIYPCINYGATCSQIIHDHFLPIIHYKIVMGISMETVRMFMEAKFFPKNTGGIAGTSPG